MKALLKEDEDRKERRRKEEEAGGDDMEDTAFVEEAGSSEEVGFREVGKRRKVARQGRFSGERGSSGAGRLDVEVVIRQLHLFPEEDRERCIRPFTVHSEEDVSGLSDANSGGAANRAAPLIGDSVLTPWVMLIVLEKLCMFIVCNSSFFVGSGKDSKGFYTFQKVKMHSLFLSNLKSGRVKVEEDLQ